MHLCGDRAVRLTGDVPALDHAHFHAALRCALQVDFVHEVANEEDAAAATFEQVFRSQRVSNAIGIESVSLISHPDDHFRNALECGRELDEHAFGDVVLIAVLDGVDDAFADGDADPMYRIFVEPDVPADMATDDFDEIHHVECARELEPNAQGMLRNHWMRMEYHPICEMMSS